MASQSKSRWDDDEEDVALDAQRKKEREAKKKAKAEQQRKLEAEAREREVKAGAGERRLLEPTSSMDETQTDLRNGDEYHLSKKRMPPSLLKLSNPHQTGSSVSQRWNGNPTAMSIISRS